MTTQPISHPSTSTATTTTWRWVCTLALLGVLAACSDSAPPAPAAAAPTPATDSPSSAASPAVDSAPSAPSAPAASSEADESAAVDDKLQTYIGCYNQLDQPAQRTISRYKSWVKNMATGPTGSEKLIYGLYPINAESIQECQLSFAEVGAIKPALEALDTAARGYIDSLGALLQVVAPAHSYYDRENYKDDQFAKGKELHAGLVKSMQDFQQASELFSTQIELENDKLLAAELARIEKTQGRKLAYWHRALMNEAKQLIAIIGDEDFSVEAATTRMNAFEAVADSAMAYGKTNQDEAPMTWFTIEQSAENFRKAAKERVRRLRDKTPYSDGEKMMLKPGSAWMVDGSTEKAIKAYNSLVESSNDLN